LEFLMGEAEIEKLRLRAQRLDAEAARINVYFRGPMAREKAVAAATAAQAAWAAWREAVGPEHLEEELRESYF
jgi:hypothetical protein